MSKKILLIDDEALVVKTVNKLLMKEGYEVIVCRNGSEALEKIQSNSFNLIVCDIRMPDMNGIETIKKIREFYKSKNLSSPPEILMTGYAEGSANEDAEALQVADYLYKPFDLRDFLKSVQRNIES